MSLSDPVNSPSGAVASREQCPAIPYTPEEYAAEARRAVEEGAAMIHIHALTPEGVPSYEIDDFRAITDAFLGAVDDVIVNYSTGALGVPIEKRLAYLRELRPDVAALNMGSMNYAKYSRRRKDFVFQAVFENSFETIVTFVETMNELGIRPEHECFDSGTWPTSTRDRHGAPDGVAPGVVRDGRNGPDPPDRAQPRPYGG